MASTSLGEAHYFEESMNATKVRSYLASSKEAEKSKGMKFLLANMSKGRDMSEFFPDVVKNVVVRAVEVKKMVYMYLVHYADATVTCRELALLSINSFQKDLAAANQLIRALALRVMTSIRVPDIIQIQLLAVYKCASDSSPYVRRCAATAIPKIFALDQSQLSSLTQALEKLLKDSSTMVLGSAVASFNEVCPTNYDLIHRCYRKLCHLLADMDEWTQISVLNVLTRYVRIHFVDPSPGTREAVLARVQQRSSAAAAAASGPVKVKRRVVKKAFYSDEEDMSAEEEVEVMQSMGQTSSHTNALFTKNADAELEGIELDPDHKLLLRSSLPLLKSRNCGVVLAVCSLHYYCGTQLDGTAAQLGKSLVRISRNRREIAFVVLKAIASMAHERPPMFRPFLHDFFVKATDPSFCRSLKLDILTSLLDSSNVTPVLRELQSYVKHSDKEFVCAAVRAVGRVADAQPEVADKCLHGLMSLIACVRSEKVAGQAIIVVRQLLQQQPADRIEESTIKQLANVLIKEKGSQVPAAARASLIWIVGEFLRFLESVAPDILRVLAQTFPEEQPEVKLQIVNMAMKLHLHRAMPSASRPGGGGGGGDLLDNDNVAKLVRYVLEMARFDTNYDIRDRTRLITASLGLAAGGQGSGKVDAAALVSLRTKAEEIFLQPKLAPLTLMGPVAMEGLPNLTISSLSWMLNHKIQGYQELPDWADIPADPSIRDAPTSKPSIDEQHTGLFISQSRSGSETDSSVFYSEGEEEGEGSQESEVEDEEGSFYDDESEAESGSYVSSGVASEEASPPRRAGGGAGSAVRRKISEEGSATESYSSGKKSDGSYSDEGGSSTYASSEGDEEREEEDLIGERRSGYDELGGLGGFLSGGGGGATATSSEGEGGRGATSLLSGMGSTPPRVVNSTSSGGFGFTPLGARRTTPQSADSPDSALLDLEAYATSKKPSPAGASLLSLGTTDGGNDVASLIQGLGETSLGRGSSSSLGGNGGGGRLTRTVLSVPKELLRHEMAGGLKVVACYTREDASVGSSLCTLLLSLTNMRDISMRRIKVVANAVDHAKILAFPDIPLIEPGSTVEVRLGFDVKDETSPSPSYRLQLCTDRGQYPLVITLPLEELMRANPITQEEAESIQRSLGGFHATKSSFSLPQGTDLSTIPDKVLQSANLALASSLPIWEEDGLACFAGLVVKKAGAGGGERVVAQVTATGGSKITLQMNCDDAMMSATLLDVVKRGITGSSSIRRIG